MERQGGYEELDPVSFFLSLDGWQESPFDTDREEERGSPSQAGNYSSDSYLLGFVLANVVGLQYYSGSISGREMVGLVREPLNRYDPNAIKVVNTRTVQVGHIERTAAAVLSPLIDQNLINVEGIVPNAGGSRSIYKLACQIHIFARIEAFPVVKSEIEKGGLMLITDAEGSFGLSEAVIIKEKKGLKEEKSLDEIFKLVDENVCRNGALEALEPPKDTIKSELFLHQKEALSWLVQRENAHDLPPFWEERNGVYANVLTNYRTDTRPEPLCGGIFADDMGLGKTLTLLSLIAFDKSDANLIPCLGKSTVNAVTVDEICDKDGGTKTQNSRKSKRGKGSKKASSPWKKRKLDSTYIDNMGKRKSEVALDELSSVSGLKSTLVVCPPSVFSTWITQLGEHTRPGSLRAYMYYGERTKKAEDLQKYDIVLTTYTTLSSEHAWPGSPLKKMEWWRVILDEAHTIKNSGALQSQAVFDLNARRRWAVTGTPIQNGTFDLFSLMIFLRFKPFSIRSYWESLVSRPLAQGNKKGLSRLQVLMATISLRRTKDKGLIGLPEKFIETFAVELSREEREIYDNMEGEARNIVRSYINSGSVLQNYSTVLSIILRLRQICTNLALCPPDLRSLLSSDSIEDVSSNPELLKKMISVLQDSDDFDCPICISPPTDTIITSCAHIYCRGCILKTLNRAQPSCPLCRRPLSHSDLFSAPPEPTETSNTESSSSRSNTSSKVRALLKFLSESRDQNPAVKSVVFSQFRKMLALLEEPLKAAGFKTLRLDGSMNAKRRAQVIREFGDAGPEGPAVLLASLKASGTGINLTAASRVYLLEPWWNPAVEEQAMDRVHRIGQKAEVKVVRLIARNSIEERILELQEKKKKLAKEAFMRKGSKDRREVSVDDLRTLVSL